MDADTFERRKEHTVTVATLMGALTAWERTNDAERLVIAGRFLFTRGLIAAGTLSEDVEVEYAY